MWQGGPVSGQNNANFLLQNLYKLKSSLIPSGGTGCYSWPLTWLPWHHMQTTNDSFSGSTTLLFQASLTFKTSSNLSFSLQQNTSKHSTYILVVLCHREFMLTYLHGSKWWNKPIFVLPEERAPFKIHYPALYGLRLQFPWWATRRCFENDSQIHRQNMPAEFPQVTDASIKTSFHKSRKTQKTEKRRPQSPIPESSHCLHTKRRTTYHVAPL